MRLAIIFLTIGVSGSASGLQNSMQYSTPNLKVSAKFPVNLAHPFEISGYDDLDRPYKISIETKEIAKNAYSVKYTLEKNGKKDSDGSISMEKGRLGKLKEGSEDKHFPDLLFESTITD